MKGDLAAAEAAPAVDAHCSASWEGCVCPACLLNSCPKRFAATSPAGLAVVTVAFEAEAVAGEEEGQQAARSGPLIAASAGAAATCAFACRGALPCQVFHLHL